MFCNSLITVATEAPPSSMENMDSLWLEIFKGLAVGKKQFTNCMYKTDNLWKNNKIHNAGWVLLEALNKLTMEKHKLSTRKENWLLIYINNLKFSKIPKENLLFSCHRAQVLGN